MTNAQKLEVRASEIRQRLNEISGLEGDKLTDEIRTESDGLQTEYRDTETKRRAAIVAEGDEAAKAVTEPTEDSETRERRELRGKARITDHLTALLTGRGVTGASAEYSDAVGTPGLMPIELLEGPEPEVRAVTPGPDSGTVTQTKATVPFAFARTDAAALGIAMPMIASGEAHFPALSTSPPAGPKSKDAAADSTAAAFSLTKRTPKRITGSFLIRVEDLALMPSMERDLRQAIAAAMADNLDSQVIGGSGAGANLSGLFHQATDVAIAGAKETFGTAIERFAGVVDGKHANGFSDVRALIGVNTFALYAALFSNNNKGDLSAYDHLREQARRAAGFDSRSGPGRYRPEGDRRPGRATPSDHRSGVEGCGIDRRPVHASREGPAGRDGGNAGRFAVHSLRGRSGYRGPPEALLNADPDCRTCWLGEVGGSGRYVGSGRGRGPARRDGHMGDAFGGRARARRQVPGTGRKTTRRSGPRSTCKRWERGLLWSNGARVAVTTSRRGTKRRVGRRSHERPGSRSTSATVDPGAGTLLRLALSDPETGVLSEPCESGLREVVRSMKTSFEVEIRESETPGYEPSLRGVMLTEGRAASGGRAEVFTNGSVTWPQDGVAILLEHRGKVEARGQVVRERDGRLTISQHGLPRAIREAVKAGKRFMSVSSSGASRNGPRPGACVSSYGP